MFWDKFSSLCAEKGRSANAIAKELSISSGCITNWKKGSNPSNSTLKKIADYFGVTAEYLLKDDEGSLDLSAHEIALINAYRAQPQKQPTIDHLLGVEMEGYVTVFAAAQSVNNTTPNQYVRMSRERWEKLKNAPETDETLMEERKPKD